MSDNGLAIYFLVVEITFAVAIGSKYGLEFGVMAFCGVNILVRFIREIKA